MKEHFSCPYKAFCTYTRPRKAVNRSTHHNTVHSLISGRTVHLLALHVSCVTGPMLSATLTRLAEPHAGNEQPYHALTVRACAPHNIPSTTSFRMARPSAAAESQGIPLQKWTPYKAFSRIFPPLQGVFRSLRSPL